MNKKNKLLSIGEISKLTKAHINSIKYYEQIGLLQPAFVDPDSGYRYYSFDQKCLIEVIQICIELDIPLKKLTEFLGEDETVNFYEILAHGKAIAEKKLASIQKGLTFIDKLKNNIDAANTFQNEIYTREMPKKYFCVILCRKPIKDIDPFEIAKTVLNLHYDIGEYAELFHFGLVDIGMLSLHSAGGVQHFMFTELPEHMAKNTSAMIMEIPAGVYMCTQSEGKQIEQASQIFSEYLNGKHSFLAIETDIFTGKYKTNKLVNELRAIATEEVALQWLR